MISHILAGLFGFGVGALMEIRHAQKEFRRVVSDAIELLHRKQQLEAFIRALYADHLGHAGDENETCYPWCWKCRAKALLKERP